MKTTTSYPDTGGAGLTEQQSDLLYSILEMTLALIHRTDPRGRHFAIMVLTHEGVAEDGCDVVSTDVLASMDNEALQDVIRDWLHRAAH